MKKIIPALLLSVILMTGCSPKGPVASGGTAPDSLPGTTSAETEKIQAVTSINAVDQLVRSIGGQRVTTSRFVPPGVDPHDFEPTPREMGLLSEAQILFINGLGMEPWAEKAGISGKTRLMVLSDGISGIALDAADQHGHGAYDPHVWLGLAELKIMARNTAAALERISPADKDYFQANLDTFNAQADALAAEFAPKFAPFAGSAFVTGHEAFGYLVRNIGLVQKGVSGPLAEGEATPQKMKELVDFVQAQGITTIFVEELISSEVSKTLARETGTTLEVLPTMEAQGEIFPTIRTIYEKVLASLEK